MSGIEINIRNYTSILNGEIVLKKRKLNIKSEASEIDNFTILNDIFIKYIRESYHIEYDYAYNLDILKFDVFPKYVINYIDEYMKKELVWFYDGKELKN